MSLKLNDSGKDKLQQILFRKGLKLESLLKQNSPVFTGQYKNLWSTEKNSDGSVSVVNPQGEKGRALEYGGGAGSWPPVDEMRKWVRRKLNPEDVDSTTYLVSRKIFQEGVNPQPHVRPSIREFKNREL
jgi:hypothetical protein